MLELETATNLTHQLTHDGFCLCGYPLGCICLLATDQLETLENHDYVVADIDGHRDMYLYEKPDCPHCPPSFCDGTQWITPDEYAIVGIVVDRIQ